MAKGDHPRQEATSPHVSLRQAVRPVIVAYGILSDQRQAASALAEEAEALLDLTEDLLRKLGMVHLLTAGSARPDGDPTQTDVADRLVEAYAHVGMSWALVVSNVKKLAELLIDECDWPTSRLLANLMAESGEAEVAKHIEARVHNAQENRINVQLARIRPHTAMPPAEVRQVIGALMALEKNPRREMTIRSWRIFLATSTLHIAQEKQNQGAISVVQELYSRANSLNRHPGLEDHPNYILPEERFFAGLIAVLDMCEG